MDIYFCAPRGRFCFLTPQNATEIWEPLIGLLLFAAISARNFLDAASASFGSPRAPAGTWQRLKPLEQVITGNAVKQPAGNDSAGCLLPIYNLISAEKTPLKKFNPWFPQNAPSKKGKNVRFIKISSYNFNKLATGSWWFFPCGYVIIAILTGPFLDFTNRWSLAELGS